MNKDSRDKLSQPALIPLEAHSLATVNGGSTWTASKWGTQAQSWRWWQ